MALLNEINVKGVPHPIVTDDGYYQEMTVGDAEQLVATTFTEDDAPYNFRTAGGAIDIGDRKQVEGIVGGTVAWNQLAQNGNFANSEYWDGTYSAELTIANNVCSYTPTQQYSAIHQGRSNLGVFIPNHVVLMLADLKGAATRNSIQMGYGDNVNFTNSKTCTVTTSFQTFGYIAKLGSTIGTTANIFIRDNYTTDFIEISAKNVMFFDLTQMFGSTIADYIYSLETANAGAGVAWFKKLFPKPYYAYNAGQLMSVKALRHITRGFNAWDTSSDNQNYALNNDGTLGANNSFATSDYIKVVAGATYYFKDVAPSANANTVAEYDENKTFIRIQSVSGSSGTSASGAKTMSGNTSFIRVARFKTSTEPCINLSWDGERDGEYEEYVEHVYELDPDLELRGIPKLSAGNDLYYDGDTYESDGTVTRKYGIVDLGTLTWNRDTTTRPADSATIHAFYASVADMKMYRYTVNPNLLVVGYEVAESSDVDYAGRDSIKDRLVGGADANGRFWIYDSRYNEFSTSQFTEAVSGLYAVYELETPTTETADPYNGTQIVDDFGTEEFVDAGVAAETRDVAIPVGHNSLYQPNLRAKLEMVPEAPEDEGYYVVYHHDGINEYVPLIIPQELPELPSEDGTYTLKCTVASGSATLSFESEV